MSASSMGSVPNGYWTRSRIVDAIREFNRIYGRTPGALDWNVSMARKNKRPDLVERFYEDGCWPHVTTLLYVFGSLNEAIRSARFEPRRPGERGPTSDYSREHSPHARSSWTHCSRGHEFTPENTYVFRGGRQCRECNRRRSREYQARRRATKVVPS